MPEEKPKKRIWDKLLMGAVIGGAIGSVVGATIATKKGKESKRFFQKLKTVFSFWKKRTDGSQKKSSQPQPQHQHNQIKKIPKIEQ